MAFNYKDTSKEHLDEHINRLVDIMDKIELNKVTVLTGGNALGKSLIRKQLPFRISDKLEKLGIKHDIKHCVTSTSMQARTESRPDWGALSSIMHDMPWSSTSDSTIHALKQLLKDREEKKYFVIDELEIGMSREVAVGTTEYVNKHLPKLLSTSHGLLVITHSADVVRTLKHDVFINIEGLTEEKWLNREVEPVDPEDIEKWAGKLFRRVEDRSKKVN